MNKYVFAAIAAIMLSSVPASAQESAAETQSIRVSFADLDLNNPADKLRLDRRVRHAAELVCGGYDIRDLRLFSLSLACRRQALARVDSQVALAVSKAARYPRDQVAIQTASRR